MGMGVGGGGGGGVLWYFIHTFKILNLTILGGFQKMNIFWCHHKIGLYLGVISVFS